MFVKQMEVGSFAIFTYIVACKETNEALVIDPASDCDRIFNEAKSRGFTIRYIVNTHCHVDHIMGNRRMKDLTGAEIVIHEIEAQALVNQSHQTFQMFGGEPSPAADRTVRDGDTIAIGNTSLSVIHTPGHSPGSISLYHSGMVFTGDTLFVGSVGRTDLDGGSWETLLASVQKKLFLLPDDTVVAPGHNYGDSTRSTIGREKLYNPFVGLRGGY